LSCRRKDGRQFSAEVSAGTIRIDDTTALLVSIRDITERTRRKRQIEFLNRLFRHNVRNRVNVLIGNAEVIKKRGSEEVADIAEVIDSVGNRFVETSEKIQEMTSILKDGVDPGVEQTNASDLVEAVVAEFRGETPGATFETSIEEDVHINGDDSIRVAVENLIENAVEHAGEGPRITVSVRHDYADTGMAEIVVADDGPGLPENERAAVANPEATSPLEHGSGLGLHLVTQTVGVYGGEFEVECPEAGGTRATIRLPLTSEPVGAAVAERAEG
jgi:signal transduction histidine kinase